MDSWPGLRLEDFWGEWECGWVGGWVGGWGWMGCRVCVAGTLFLAMETEVFGPEF